MSLSLLRRGARLLASNFYNVPGSSYDQLSVKNYPGLANRMDPYRAMPFTRTEECVTDDHQDHSSKYFENLEPRADGTDAHRWYHIEHDPHSIMGWKAYSRPTPMTWDEGREEVLPLELRMDTVERYVRHNTINPKWATTTPGLDDLINFREYRVIEFPAGKFLHVAGNLVRVDYQDPYVNYKRPLKVQYGQPQKAVTVQWGLPIACNNYLGGGTMHRLIDNIQDIFELGVRNWWMKQTHLGWAWWGKENKILIGIDRLGNKYWEAPIGLVYIRSRWVEKYDGSYGTGMTAYDLPQEWLLWLQRIIIEPPNSPRFFYMKWTDNYAHSHDRWAHQCSPYLSSTENEYYSPSSISRNRTHANVDDPYRYTARVKNFTSAWVPHHPDQGESSSVPDMYHRYVWQQ